VALRYGEVKLLVAFRLGVARTAQFLGDFCGHEGCDAGGADVETKFKHRSGAHIDLSRVCPERACIGGIVWAKDGPVHPCPVCKGEGRVSLSEWIRHTCDDGEPR